MNKIPKTYFFFDSKNLFHLLTKNKIPELYECVEVPDEYECWIKVENSESFKRFIKHLKDVSCLNISEIEELLVYIFEGTHTDDLEKAYGYDKTESILEDGYTYLKSLYSK